VSIVTASGSSPSSGCWRSRSRPSTAGRPSSVALPAPAPGRLAAWQDPGPSTAAPAAPTGPTGPRPAAPRRHPDLAQAGGAADGPGRPAGRVPAQALALLDPPGPRATPAPDLVDRDFTAEASNRLGVADISRIPTGGGRCGWHLSATPSPGGSWAKRPATEPMSTWCWARWSPPSGPRPGQRSCPGSARPSFGQGRPGRIQLVVVTP
jgi:hypothetical protein